MGDTKGPIDLTEQERDPRKNELQPHRFRQWVISPEYDAEFVSQMERVPDLHHEPTDPVRLVVCVDESYTLHRDHNDPLPAGQGAGERVNHYSSLK